MIVLFYDAEVGKRMWPVSFGANKLIALFQFLLDNETLHAHDLLKQQYMESFTDFCIIKNITI